MSQIVLVEIKVEAPLNSIYSPDTGNPDFKFKQNEKTYFIYLGKHNNMPKTIIGIYSMIKLKNCNQEKVKSILKGIDIKSIKGPSKGDLKAVLDEIYNLKSEIEILFDRTILLYNLRSEVLKAKNFYYKVGAGEWKVFPQKKIQTLTLKVDHYNKFENVMSVDNFGIYKYNKILCEANSLISVSPNAAMILAGSGLEIILNTFMSMLYPSFKNNLRLGDLLGTFYEIILQYHPELKQNVPHFKQLDQGIKTRNKIVHSGYLSTETECSRFLTLLNTFCKNVGEYCERKKGIISTPQTLPPAAPASDLPGTESSHDPGAPPS